MEEILTLEDVMEDRSLFWKKDREEQRQWLLHFFFLRPEDKKMEKQLGYTVNKEKEVCQKAWNFSHGLSYGRYKNYKNAVSSSAIVTKLLTSSL